ncbi:MAG: cytochrome c3 family protein [Burkholderiaceae bacterium]
MKKILSMISCCLTAIALSAAAQSAEIAETHAKRGAACTACHENSNPAAGDFIETEKCLACHSRDSIKAPFKSMGKKNPHDNHLGEIDCNLCHTGHKPFELYCKQCHTDFKDNLR